MIVVIVIIAEIFGEPVDDSSLETSSENVTSEVKKTPAPKKETTHKNDDLDLITKKGHPKLYDSAEKAHEFYGDKKWFLGLSWKDANNRKIYYPDDFDDVIKNCILHFDCNAFYTFGYDYIFGVAAQLNPKLNLNDVIKIVKSYLPLKLLKKEFVLNESVKIKYGSRIYYYCTYNSKEAGGLRISQIDNLYTEEYIEIILEKTKKHWSFSINDSAFTGNPFYGRNDIRFEKKTKEKKWKYDYFK